jgi:hypothetical protein
LFSETFHPLIRSTHIRARFYAELRKAGEIGAFPNKASLAGAFIGVGATFSTTVLAGSSAQPRAQPGHGVTGRQSYRHHRH